jgi:hypothetical protein
MFISCFTHISINSLGYHIRKKFDFILFFAIEKTYINKHLCEFQGVADLNIDVLTSAMVPHCFLSSFKVFQFKGFNANEHDICLVKFMLENALNLEKITISPAFWLRYADIDMKKVKEQILSLPKCSSFCIVEFSDISSSWRFTEHHKNICAMNVYCIFVSVGFLVMIYLSSKCNLKCNYILYYFVMRSLMIIQFYHYKEKY